MEKFRVKEIRALMWEAGKLQDEYTKKLAKVWTMINEDLKKNDNRNKKAR